jgi:hypothetical protein
MVQRSLGMAPIVFCNGQDCGTHGGTDIRRESMWPGALFLARDLSKEPRVPYDCACTRISKDTSAVLICHAAHRFDEFVQWRGDGCAQTLYLVNQRDILLAWTAEHRRQTIGHLFCNHDSVWQQLATDLIPRNALLCENGVKQDVCNAIKANNL